MPLLRLLTIALVVFVGGCAVPEPRARLTVVTWNIHHGRGLDDRVDVARLADELRAVDADLIALQEVDVGVERSGRIDIPAELATRLGMDHAFGKNIDFQGGDYGNAILSRHPIVAHDNHRYRDMLRAGEQRGALTVQVDTPFGRVALVNTHLDYRPDDAERLACSAELRERTAELDASPVLVCGDFNDLPGSPVHIAMLDAFDDAWPESVGVGASYPAAAPTKRIDWVLVRRDAGAAWRTVAARVVPTAASDHAMVVVELER